MRISLNWLKELVRIPVSDEELVRLIGARLVEVEEVIDERHKYDKIFVARVEKSEKIAGTHLTKCLINVGEAEVAGAEKDASGLIQVMCGAPNVREGMLAAWIAPGAIVPASVKEDAPFKIGKRQMLGKYDSFGMLAGADELDFGDDHSGIVEIDPSAAEPGEALAEVFELNDLILDIENKSLTHRPDCFGVIGFAREVAGILGEKFEADDAEMTLSGDGIAESVAEGGKPADGVYPKGHKDLARVAWELLPEGYAPSTGLSSSIDISIEDADICSRYSAVVLEKHGELKKKYLSLIDTRLAKAGMRPIDPIVDATNYLMLLTGQPLHAFDFDKFVAVGGTKKPEIKVRLAKEGEKLKLLDGAEVLLNGDDIVICSGETPVALAGAMGGESTEIDERTRNIIIESATFSLYHLRKTQMAHGIFSEAITRFTKGQPAYQTLSVAGACAKMLADGFKVAAVADEHPAPEKLKPIKISAGEINGLLGTDYSAEVILRTLSNVGFKVEVSASKVTAKTGAEGEKQEAEDKNDLGAKTRADGGNETEFEVLAPEWRTDIHIKEDVIEEIGRLLGYDNIIPTLPLHATAEKNALFDLKREIRETLARFGANEVLTYSFVSGKLLEKAGQNPENSYRIVNSISPELQYVRQSLIPSLLDKTYLNEKLPVEEFAMFEMNKVYQRSWGLNEEGVPVEGERLGLVVAKRKGTGTAFYLAKRYIEELMRHLGIAVKITAITGVENGKKASTGISETGALSATDGMADKTTGGSLSAGISEADGVMLEEKRAGEIFIEGEKIGVIGELKNSVKHEFKLADYVAAAEIDLPKILQYCARKKIETKKVKRVEDITIESEKSYAETLAEVADKYKDAEISPLSIYQAPGEKSRKISFRLKFREK